MEDVGWRIDGVEDPAGDFIACQVGGGLVEGGGVEVAGVVLSQGIGRTSSGGATRGWRCRRRGGARL